MNNFSINTATIAVVMMEEMEEDEEPTVSYDDIEMMVRDELIQLCRSNKRKRPLDDDGNPPKREYTRYNRERAQQCVNEDYFGPKPTFNDRQFERFFRITLPMAEGILNGLASNDPYWHLSYDCTGRMSIDPKVKLVAALKMACYGVSFTAWKDYAQMGESTAREGLSKLMRYLVMDPEISWKFLRKMTKSDARKVAEMHQREIGIEGNVGMLDVSQIPWGNCPHEQKGQHVGKEGEPTLGLELMSDMAYRIWHWNFGSPGSLNDINAWERSSLLHDMIHGVWHELDFEYEINGEKFNMLWMFVDLIYPQLRRFLRSIANPVTKIDRYFANWQESKRKGVECTIGVLKKKFHSLVHPIRLFYVDDIYYLVGGCIVLHNMMVTERIERDQRDGSMWYELVAEKDPQNQQYQQQNVTASAAAKAAIAEEDAYLEANAALADPNNNIVDLTFQEKLRQAKLLTKNLRYVEYYWSELNNVQEHMRLQNAVKNEVYGSGRSDGNELARFDPLEAFDSRLLE